jgi:membrane protease YdiL (CAAX protease family)
MLQKLSPRVELILVNLLCFGPFAVRSIIGVVEQREMIVFDDRAALTLLAIELTCGTLAALLLRARGWTLAGLGLRPTLRQTIGGTLLLMGTTIVIGGIYEMVRASTNIDPGAVTDSRTQLTWPVLIALTLVNPLYDEIFGVAYNVTASQANGAAFAIALSAIVRLVCHLEHGPIATVTILPLAVIFAAVFWRWRVVWPLIVAHGVMDFVGYVSERG